MKQASAWGQFWFDLYSRHRVSGCGICTPLQPNAAKSWRGAYHSLWIQHSDKGPVYLPVDGDTMVGMLQDGLVKTGCDNLHMKLTLLDVAIDIVLYQLERRL